MANINILGTDIDTEMGLTYNQIDSLARSQDYLRHKYGPGVQRFSDAERQGLREGALAALERTANAALVPTTLEDAALTTALGPVGAKIRKGALALLGGTYSPESEGALVGAGSRVSRGLWAKAKELWAGNKPNADIWRETGWYKGPEGWWRTEIPDNDLQFRLDFDNIPKSQRGINEQLDMPLGGIISHRALSEAYPDLLRNYRGNVTKQAQWLPDSAQRASHTPPFLGTGVIPTKPGLIDIRAKSLPNALDSAAHELQHAIQTFEGLPAGTSPDNFRHAAPLREALVRAMASGDGLDPVTKTFDFDIERMLKNAVDDPFEAYLRNAGEAEARAVARRRLYTPAQRLDVFPLDDYDVPLNELTFK